MVQQVPRWEEPRHELTLLWVPFAPEQTVGRLSLPLASLASSSQKWDSLL